MTTVHTVKVKPSTSTSWKTLLNLVYPVGSYYISTKPTDPAELFGGSWVPVLNRFLYAINPWNQTATLDPRANPQYVWGGSHNAIIPYHTHSVTKNPVYSYEVNGTSHSHSYTFDIPPHTHGFDHKHYISEAYQGYFIPSANESWSTEEGGALSGTGRTYTYINAKPKSISFGGNVRHTSKNYDKTVTDGGGGVELSNETGPGTLSKINILATLKESAEIGYTGQNSSGTDVTQSNTANANMPGYQKVYCWWREA